MSERTAEVLRAEGLVKTHHGEGAPAHAVRGVDLRVARGEFVAVTGPSGAGKSTLLHLLGGLQRPDAGSIWLDGVCTDGYGEARWAVERRKREPCENGRSWRPVVAQHKWRQHRRGDANCNDARRQD